MREPESNTAPIELLAYNEPYPGVIRARRAGEPAFSHVQSMGDAYLAARSRGVRVVASSRLLEELRVAGELAPGVPSWLDVRQDQ